MQGQNFKRTLFSITSSDSSNTLPTLLKFCSMLPKCVKGAGYWFSKKLTSVFYTFLNYLTTSKPFGSLLDESLEVTESYTFA